MITSGLHHGDCLELFNDVPDRGRTYFETASKRIREHRDRIEPFWFPQEDTP